MAETAKDYANALFSLADERNMLDEIYESLDDSKKIFEENPEYTFFLASPSVPKKERISALLEAFDWAPEYTRSFLAILVERDMVKEFEKCVKEFTLLYQAAKKRIAAYVYSATELSEEQVSRLKSKLEKQSGREVELIRSVDKSLLGGVLVRMEETVFDGSVKRRLQNMKEEIGT